MPETYEAHRRAWLEHIKRLEETLTRRNREIEELRDGCADLDAKNKALVETNRELGEQLEATNDAVWLQGRTARLLGVDVETDVEALADALEARLMPEGMTVADVMLAKHIMDDIVSPALGDDYVLNHEECEAALESRLMPDGMEWPRFEDGEPVKLGDEFATGDGSLPPDEATAVSLSKHVIQVKGIHCFENYAPGERVKRPAPKVLDADGAEIRVGDTVYADGLGYTVSNVDGRAVSASRRSGHIVSELRCFPEHLTHTPPEPVDAPVDADGAEIKAGDEVWGKPGLSRKEGHYRVTKAHYLNADLGRRFTVKAEDLEEDEGSELRECWLDPSLLTHNPPEKPESEGDSWESIEREAIIHYGGSSIAAELVRRAKALGGGSDAS